MSRSLSKVCVMLICITVRVTRPRPPTAMLLLTPAGVLSGMALGTSVDVYSRSDSPAAQAPKFTASQASAQSGSAQSTSPSPSLSLPSLQLISTGDVQTLGLVPVQV